MAVFGSVAVSLAQSVCVSHFCVNFIIYI